MDKNMCKKILIVDDYQSNVMLLKTILRDKKYILETAYNGKEALEKIDSFGPDILLLDIMMPGKDGYEVVEKIREDVGYNHIVIILITALDSEKNIEKGLSLGANHYLVKPFLAKDLIALINKSVED
ncbi:MAG: response regulator [Phocaeicola sp.]